jgi:hypothetical protein
LEVRNHPGSVDNTRISELLSNLLSGFSDLIRIVTERYLGKPNQFILARYSASYL